MDDGNRNRRLLKALLAVRDPDLPHVPTAGRKLDPNGVRSPSVDWPTQTHGDVLEYALARIEIGRHRRLWMARLVDEYGKPVSFTIFGTKMALGLLINCDFDLKGSRPGYSPLPWPSDPAIPEEEEE